MNETHENHENEMFNSAGSKGEAKSGGMIKMKQIKINSRYKAYFLI